MAVTTLDAGQVARLQDQALTYTGVGRTAAAPPAGYAFFSRTRTLARGRDFESAAHALFTWQVHTRAGLEVAASTRHVAVDALVVMRLGVGRLALRIPCRVVYVIDEPDRRGFAYGTLPGHPESGEESFILHRRDDGEVDFVITAFSRPATLLVKISGPAGRAIQQLMTTRYLRALDA